jgi:hypothetical protein
MKKMQEKSKIYSIKDKSINSPSNQAIRMANTNVPLQISKARRIKGFGKDIGQLSLGVYVPHLNISFLYMVSQEVVSPLKVSHIFVEDMIFGYRDDTGVIILEGNSPKAQSKVSHGVHNPQNLGVAAIYSTSVVN